MGSDAWAPGPRLLLHTAPMRRQAHHRDPCSQPKQPSWEWAGGLQDPPDHEEAQGLLREWLRLSIPPSFPGETLEPHQPPGWLPSYLSLLLPFSSSWSSLSDSLLDSPEPLSLLLLLSEALSDSGSVEGLSQGPPLCTDRLGSRAGALGPRPDSAWKPHPPDATRINQDTDGLVWDMQSLRPTPTRRGPQKQVHNLVHM